MNNHIWHENRDIINELTDYLSQGDYETFGAAADTIQPALLRTAIVEYVLSA